MWGDQRHDWALLRLHNCVGLQPEFGWIESAYRSRGELQRDKAQVAVLGYAFDTKRGEMSVSVGSVRDGTPPGEPGIFFIDASGTHKQSGGAVMVIEKGQLRLGGLFQGGLSETSGATFEHWEPVHSNLAVSAFEILYRPEVKALLDADKGNWKPGNPAAERQANLPSLRLPRQGSQRAGEK